MGELFNLTILRDLAFRVVLPTVAPTRCIGRIRIRVWHLALMCLRLALQTLLGAYPKDDTHNTVCQRTDNITIRVVHVALVPQDDASAETATRVNHV